MSFRYTRKLEVTIARFATLMIVAAAACVFSSPARSSGDGFFQSVEVIGNPEFVLFGSVKDERGKYLQGALVRVSVPVHQIEFTVETDVIGRFRTPDIGRAIKDLGYEVDPSQIWIDVEYSNHVVLNREYRGKYRQTRGAIEVNFRMKKSP